MAQSYESEQAMLSKNLAELEESEASYGEKRNSIDDFIEQHTARTSDALAS